MADKKYPKKPEDKPNQNPDQPNQETPRPDKRGREHQVHQEILERRMRGGKSPEPTDYRRALEQWKELPGSIVRPPTDITAPPEEKVKPEDQGDSPPLPGKPDKDEEEEPR